MSDIKPQTPINVSTNETGIIRLYDITLPDTQAKALTATDVQQALGVDRLNGDYIDIFPISTLQGVGLLGYMIDGLGIAADDLVADKDRIDQITGYVVVILSRAFGGQTVTLRPDASLQLIGTYSEAQSKTAPVDLQAETAQPKQADTPPSKKPKSNAAISGMVATVALLVMFALVGLMIWIGG
ncbi:hypothetical protein [Parasulfitobacter algicola]|uniref:Uncharacterized protein n=1 Tax=Parasulfitobacter algicola TaxID=2614809 RepID=A0ABX2IUC0_9RHOB|nr:hypothetical protein [Sulfitobacter algicola]NSX56492.1 hypothetical protein [Sulfitobacter algicola]